MFEGKQFIAEEIEIQLDDPRWLPERAHYGDAGLDCKSRIDCFIPPNSTLLVGCGFRIAIPFGYAGFLVSRSGQSKIRVSLANRLGIIDHQYRGEIMARLENLGSDPYNIFEGDRIAQLIIVPIMLPELKIVEQLSSTDRGQGGFGSTGVQ